MISLYLDNCCYNRPFDDLRQERIRIYTIFKRDRERSTKIKRI